MTFSIFTAYPRGYCAGVYRAIYMLGEIVSKFPPPIYVNHEIIHNRYVVKMFERKGVIFEKDLEQIPPGSLVVISAHGTGPSYYRDLQKRGLKWVDATCPLVEKVHREARDFISKGYHILYIGKKGHQEALGILDEGEKYFTLIEKIEDLADFYQYKEPSNSVSGEQSMDCHIELYKNSDSPRNDDIQEERQRKLALLTQTTLSIDETHAIILRAKELFPEIILPKVSDICYATMNRQRAVKILAEKCDLILVVGSKNSSNSNKLRHVAGLSGKKSYLIDDASEIQEDWLVGVSSVGVTAGASGPEELVTGVMHRLSSFGGIFDHELRVVEEKMEFPYILQIQG